jgi:peptide-methionine (S)-S-oxide reductase
MKSGYEPKSAGSAAGSAGRSSGAARELATIGGGCFWCIEALFNELKGVEVAISGYAGGHVDDPTYEQVCTEDTGHAEAVQITFNPEVLSYKDILEIFYAIHDPTTPNQQGNDVGPQYRSVIFYHDESQKEVADEVTKDFAAKHWTDSIVTEIAPLEKFWPAEDYHQNYFANNPEKAYCQVVINPKLAKFRQTFAQRLK